MKKTFALILLTALSLTTAKAQLIDVQFKGGWWWQPVAATQTGGAVIGAETDIWNTFAQGTGSSVDADSGGLTSGGGSLNYVDGSASGITLTWNGQGGYNGMFVQPNAFASGSCGPLMNAYLYATDTGAVTLAGLNPTQTYDLYVYSDSNTNGRKVTFTINGLVTSSLTTAESDTSLNTFVAGTNYGSFKDLSPDASGNLTISFTSPIGIEADFNGFQLVRSVPEPSTYAMMGVGAIALFVVFRRKVHALA